VPRWTRRRFLAAAIAAPAMSAACSDSPVPPPGPRALRYGDDPAQVGDLWLPDGAGPHPVVVLVHGGFWRSQYDRSLMDDLASDLPGRGWAAWNIEYRRVGSTGGGWPATFDDVAAAVDHLADIAGDEGLDVDRVVTVGHSAGGQLSLWLAARPGLAADAPGANPRIVVAAGVSQAGVVDLRLADEQGLGGTAVADLIGGRSTQDGDRYALCSPIERLPLGVPSLCVHGTNDDVVPVEQSERFVAAAVAAGDESELVTYRGGHFEVLVPGHESWIAITDRLDSLSRTS
jgi:acetyl esterase/lipase